MQEAMKSAAEALDWKNLGLLEMFGLRLGSLDECTAPKTVLEQFFDQAKLCAMAPWWGWGLVQATGIARADRNASRPLHLVRAHPQGQYFDFAYTPLGSSWSLLYRATPWDAVQRNILEHGIAGVVDDMRRALSAFNVQWKSGGNNGTAAQAAPVAPIVRRHERTRQSKPNRAHAGGHR